MKVIGFVCIFMLCLCLSYSAIALESNQISTYEEQNAAIQWNSDRSVPSQPNDLTITMTGDTTILAWTAVSTADRYIIEGSNSYKTGFIDVSSTGSFSNLGSVIRWTTGSSFPYRYYKVVSYVNSMIYINGGTFNNGTSDVTVSSFYLDKYEVTQNGYQAVMGKNPSNFPNNVNAPVELISWFNAIEYCNKRSIIEGLTPCYNYSTYGTNPVDWPVGWSSVNSNHLNISCNWTANGYRLPTEAEWHFAARGGNLTHNYTYSGSNDVSSVAWWSSNSGGTTHHVGTKPANELGLYDMSGNVWEWCWDINAPYPTGPQTNPTGPVTGTNRITRSGSWFCPQGLMPITYRFPHVPTFNFIYLGIRVCRSGT